MKILIVPEDQTYDSFVVKPVVEALLKDAGISARVMYCQNRASVAPAMRSIRCSFGKSWKTTR